MAPGPHDLARFCPRGLAACHLGPSLGQAARAGLGQAWRRVLGRADPDRQGLKVSPHAPGTGARTHSARIPLAATPTLPALFRERVSRTPGATAYIQYERGRWQAHSWAETAAQVARWQAALRRCGLVPGQRVALMCRNRWEWVICDQAALGLGLVLVPLYPRDRPDNVAWILHHCGAAVLIIESAIQWRILAPVLDGLAPLRKVVSIEEVPGAPDRVCPASRWLPERAAEPPVWAGAPDDLATIVYTSGTTGRPKGVMLSHHNILWDIHAALELFDLRPEDRTLSFLPLSHTLERTVGYYLPMVAGVTVAYSRSVAQLAEDLEAIHPTLMITVPRIFERMHTAIESRLVRAPTLRRALFHQAVETGWRQFLHRQGRAPWSARLLLHPLLDRLVGAPVRARLGGRLRLSICGGAALNPQVARTFISLGIPVLQGYGLTETSPVISTNTLEDNVPDSVGRALPGIEVRTTADGELLTRSPAVMLGYWRDPLATRAILDREHWLHSGDRAEIDASAHIRITGRLKEIIVLSTGEKVPPADMETAITLDPCVDQAMLIGEGRPYLAALVVANPAALGALARDLDPGAPAARSAPRLEAVLLQRIQHQLRSFPGHAQVHRIALVPEPWTPDNGLLTPTLKLRRDRILTRHRTLVEALYAGPPARDMGRRSPRGPGKADGAAPGGPPESRTCAS